jgi:hypothetical protein
VSAAIFPAWDMDDSQSGGAARAAWKWPAAPLTSPLAEVAAIVLLCPLFLAAAWWNGFPFVFFDTGAYVLEGLAHFFVPERAAVYSLFLYYAGAKASLWYVAAAQCLIIAFVLTEFARAVAPRTSLWKLLGIGLALLFFTSLPWFAADIEPDSVTAALAMALYLLAFHARLMGWIRGALLVAIAAFATAAHPSHLGLSAGLVMALAALRLVAAIRPRLGLPKPNLPLLALSFALGFSLVLAANYSLTHKVFVSRSGSVFLFARLLGEGIAKQTLDEICPTRHLKLCAVKDKLPPTADDWLWGPQSPFNDLGRFKGTERESAIVVDESLRRHPLASFGLGLLPALVQFTMMRTGDGIAPQQWVLDPEFRHFMPKQIAAYHAARQQQDVVRFKAVNVVHVTIAFLSLFWLGLILRRAIRQKRWNQAVLPAYVFLALIGNALVCGIFSGPHDRYQSRIVWLAVAVLLLLVRPRRAFVLPRPVESGT